MNDSEAMNASKTGRIEERVIGRASAIRKEVPINRQDATDKKGTAKKVTKKQAFN